MTLHKPFSLVILLICFSISCSNEQESSDTSITETPIETDSFFSNLSSLCGESFTGASTFPDEEDHVLVNTELNANITYCDDHKVVIDLYRDVDTWHTSWVLEKRENGLHLYHDHIGEKEYPEGEEPLTGYGGYVDESDSATRVYFPADQATKEMLPEATTNVWMMEVDLENGKFVYSLERHQEPRFRAELFLNK